MMFVFGFFPISMALRGKGDVVTALKFGIIPGIFGFVLTYYFFSTANNVLLPQIVAALLGSQPVSTTVAVATQLYAVQVVAFILGMASAAFTAVGITGFTFKPEAAPLTANVVNLVGIFLVILGIFVGYWYTFLPFYTVLIAALMVVLFGVACLLAGYSVLGKIKGGDALLGIVFVNGLLAFVILFMETL
jgi:hypothetical protein